jgi:signal transduction histidine kinase
VSGTLKVLLVEDDPGDAQLIRASLSGSNRFAVEQCGGLEEALPRLRAEPFDLVLVGLSPPAGVGLRALEQLRQTAPSIPVVAMMPGEDDALEMEVLRAGAQECLVKGSATAGSGVARALRRAVHRNQARQGRLEAGGRQDDLLSLISHELRTPLTVIVGRAQMLLEGTPDPAAVRRGLEAIHGAARALSELADGLLDFSRIASGRLSLSPALVDVRTALQPALDRAAQHAGRKKAQITTSMDPEAVVWADPDRLQQALATLLVNGVTRAPENGRVELTVCRVGGQVEIRVADDGNGIARDVLPHVFERFGVVNRASGSLGHGLALALVKRLAEMHGGAAFAESEGEGRGAVFAIRLPGGPAADA